MVALVVTLVIVIVADTALVLHPQHETRRLPHGCQADSTYATSRVTAPELSNLEFLGCGCRRATCSSMPKGTQWLPAMHFVLEGDVLAASGHFTASSEISLAL